MVTTRLAGLRFRRHDPLSANYTKILEARGGIEPPIRVLQTLALPLGDRATDASEQFDFRELIRPKKHKTRQPVALAAGACTEG
jgi:hypothetical protein